MDLEWIQTFVTAADEGNFHRTAERLHLTQSTVSIQIQKLESIWGVTLFDRVGRNVQLSRAGHRFLAHAKLLLDDYTASLEDMARWQQGFETTLKIIASPVLATTWLPRWIQGFAKLYPNVEFSIQVVDSESILSAVLQHEADLGLSRLAIAHPQATCEKLYEDPIVLIAPRDEFDFEGPARTLTDLLEQYPMFTHHHPDYWDKLMLNLRAEIPLMRTIRVNQSHVALEWVTERLGISFFSVSTVRKALLRASVEQIPFNLFPLPTTNTYLVMPIVPTALSKSFVNFIRRYIENHF